MKPKVCLNKCIYSVLVRTYDEEYYKCGSCGNRKWDTSTWIKLPSKKIKVKK